MTFIYLINKKEVYLVFSSGKLNLTEYVFQSLNLDLEG
jgi:hypothetical protein